MSEIIMLGGMGIFYIAAMIRLNNTYKRYMAIIAAILEYQKDCSRKGIEDHVSTSDMKSYYKAFIRIWDWGYTNILSKEKFELIKSYIK